MKKLLLAPFLAFLLSGCATLFPGLTTGNPVADMTAFVQVATFADGLALDAWSIAKAYIPPSNLAADTDLFNKSQDVFVGAIQTTQDAIAAYQAGQSQDWSLLISNVQNAIDEVVLTLAKLGVMPVKSSKVGLMSSQFASHFAALQNAQATVHRYR